MRLEKAVWHNMGPHADWELDLTKLDPAQRLVALMGPNGRGKSFSLESAVAGACYGSMPTQGTLVKRATAVDSWLESTLVYGGTRYRIRHMANASSGKGEVLCQVDDGSGRFVPAYNGGTGIKLFKAEAEKRLPDPDVLFASIFAAQQQEGFVKMTSGERIGVILRVIGVAKFERMAAVFRKRGTEAGTQAEVIARRIADIRGGSRDVATCEAALAHAKANAEVLRRELAEAEAELKAGKEQDAQTRVVATERDAAARELSALQQQLDEVRQKREPIAIRVTNNRAVLADAQAIRAAAARSVEIQAEIAAADKAVAEAKAAADAVMAPWLDVNQRMHAEQARLQRADERLRDAHAVERAKADLVALRDAAADADAEVARLTAKLEELAATHLAGADERIGELRGSLDSIREAVDANENAEAGDLAQIAREALETDDTAVALAATLPAQQREARERLAVAKARQAETQRQLATAERYAARGPEMDAAAVEQAEAQAELQRLRTGYAAAGAEGKVKAAAHVEAVAAANALRLELSQLAVRAGRLAPLEQAETRLAEIEPQLAAFDADVARLEAAIAARPPLPVVPARPNLLALEDAADRAHNALGEAKAAVARAEQELEHARAVSAKASEFEQELAIAQAEQEHWARLALDFGRDGIQSAEVDSAGPELTELINDLLHTCHGPRFTVSVETQRLSADGKRAIEECNIRVIDTVAGTDKEVREHSGGERVILGEAISLALTMLACRRAGWERPTLIRDESAAALDPGNARAWIAMMRRAVELTGADRLLFVSHSPEVVEMADAQIEVGAPVAMEARAA